MISNDVVELPEWSGRYGTFLTGRGKIISDFFYYKLPETLLIDVACDLLPVMKETLEKRISMDEVELEDLSERVSHFSLQGPRVPDLVEKVFGNVFPEQSYGVRKLDWRGALLRLVAKPELAESGCEPMVSYGQATA
jgi:glycine cleavage system aminomethyltransferase T